MEYSIYTVNLDPTIGHEIRKTRPCMVISPDEMNASLGTVIVAPMTSTFKAIPTRVRICATPDNGLANDSYVALDQIKTVDKRRLSCKAMGRLTDTEAEEISAILCQMFTKK